MSIDVSHGFRFFSPDIFEAQAFVDRMRDHFTSKHRLSYSSYFTNLAVERFDDAILAKAGHREPPAALADDLPAVMSVYRDWLTLPDKETALLHAILAPDISVIVYPHKQALYAEVETTDRKVFDYILSQTDVADFSYLDKLERPDRVDVEEWERRSEVWNAIDAGKWPRKTSGLVTIVSSIDTIGTFPDRELVVSCIPPHGERARHAAIRMTMLAHKISFSRQSEIRRLIDAPESGYAEYLRLVSEVLPLHTSGIAFRDD